MIASRFVSLAMVGRYVYLLCLKCTPLHTPYLRTQVTATFDLPGIKKHNAHVSYRGSHLTVTWETVKITETNKGKTLIREREKKEFSRTIPLPEGTKVSSYHLHLVAYR